MTRWVIWPGRGSCPIYTLELGSRLPEGIARQRIAGVPEDQDQLHEVVDLLGDLRHEHPSDQLPPSDRAERRLEHV